VRLGVARAVAWAHRPDGPLRARTARLRAGLARRVRPDVTPALRSAPRSVGEGARGGAVALPLAALCTTLHALRLTIGTAQQWFEQSRFVPGPRAPAGVWAGPLFHHPPNHLGGDLLSLLLFGLLLEWATGHGLTAVLIAFGLWATNPLSTWLVTPLLQRLRPDDVAPFLAVADVGWSSVVDALVGAVAMGLKRPALLLVPFAANGAYLCVVKSSWLSVHHLIGLAGGMLAGWLWRRRRTAPGG